MSKKNVKLIVHFAIMVAIYLIISHLPHSEPLTDTGIKVLAIMVAAIYGWCTIDTVVPSILAVITFGLVSGSGVAGAVLTGSGSFLIMMILAMLMICGIMIHTGLAKVFAEKIINSKIANGRPWILMLLILIAAGVSSLILPGLAVVLVVWDIAYGIFETCGYQKGEKWPTVILIAICAAPTFGMVCSHVSSGVIPNVAIIQAIDPSLRLNALSFTGFGIIQLAIFIPVCLLIIKFIFKPDVSKLKNYKAPDEKVRMNTDQKRALWILIAFIVLITVPDFLPAGSVTSFLQQFGIIGWGFLFVAVALLIRNKDGSHFITFKQITDASVYWDMLFMLASIQVVCGGLSNPEFGISTWMMQILQPLVMHLGPFGVVAVLMLLGLVVTNLLDSAVTTFVFTAITYTVANAVGLNTMGLFSILLHVSAFGMLLPACSPPLTLLYGKVEDGWVSNKDILKSAWPYITACAVICILIGYATMNLY